MKNYFYFGNTFENLIEIEDKSVTLFYFHLPKTLFVKKKYLEEYYIDDLLTFGSIKYEGEYENYLIRLAPYLMEALKKLSEKGVLYLRGDNRILHYVKALLLDRIFGRKHFVNEVIWAVENARKSPGKWPSKHENMLVYSKKVGQSKFNLDEIDRLEYMAPALVTEEKRIKGKLPTDTWWHTQLTEEELINRIIVSSTDKKDLVLNLFPKGNNFGDVCIKNSRCYIHFEKSKDKYVELMNHFGIHMKKSWVNIDPQEIGKG